MRGTSSFETQPKSQFIMGGHSANRDWVEFRPGQYIDVKKGYIVHELHVGTSYKQVTNDISAKQSSYKKYQLMNEWENKNVSPQAYICI